MYYPRILRHITTSTKRKLPSSLYDDIDNLAMKLMKGNRAALSRGITLTESDAERHRTRAERLMNRIAKETSSIKSKKSKRIGIAGPPGAGKSTFIESFGMTLIENGHRVAVRSIRARSARNFKSFRTFMFQLRLEEYDSHRSLISHKNKSRKKINARIRTRL